MAEAVGDGPLPLGSHRSPQGSPAGLTVEVGGDGIAGIVPALHRWQINRPGLPSLQQVPSLRVAVRVHQRQRIHPPWFRVAAAAALPVAAPPERIACRQIGADAEVLELTRPQTQLSKEPQGIDPPPAGSIDGPETAQKPYGAASRQCCRGLPRAGPW